MGEELELRSICKSFPLRGTTTSVLENISLHVSHGEFVSIIGPSGSGKSTLFHIIGGLISPNSGQVLIKGRETTGHSGLVSYMPQDNTLLPWRTIVDNLVLEREIAGLPRKESLQIAHFWLTRIGLDRYSKEYPAVLSGGMKRRVAFLRSLISPHDTMLLDEPFGSLDALTRLDMQQWLMQIWEEHKRTVLFITHSIEEALYLSDRVYVLSTHPARVLEEIQITFPRPRTSSVLSDPLFIRKRDHIRQLMLESSEQSITGR